MKYRKKLIVIEAFQNGEHIEPEWFTSRINKDVFKINMSTGYHHRDYAIRTFKGFMSATDLDWIIKGTKGEIYPCKDDIFRESYEEFVPESQ